ncbi:MAG: tRNA (adenosine(37)-N6)-threonylcarbamoyltransferase complex transferase subunit TsaD [Spirochaetota bacterium]
MRILAIETSCDETAIALVEAEGGIKSPKFKVLKNLITSQVKIHRPFGGVVPNLAKREHLKNLPILFKQIQNTKYKIQDIDLIAVTVGPGLEPALWTGINFAESLYKEFQASSFKFQAKLVGANHLSGHLYSFLLGQKTSNSKHEARNSKQKKFGFRNSDFVFPAIALLVSGGHTILLLMKDLTHYKKLGETRDDAVGECFDKMARLLELPYPGGPEIEKLAKLGNPKAVDFPRPMLNQKNYDFSFSGLKTSVLYFLRDKGNATCKKVDVAASFQAAAFDVLIKKTLRAVEEFGAKSVMISGGVAANHSLRNAFRSALKLKTWNLKLKPQLLVTKFPTDNAAMIAAGAYVDFLNKKKYKMVANGNLSL